VQQELGERLSEEELAFQERVNRLLAWVEEKKRPGCGGCERLLRRSLSRRNEAALPESNRLREGGGVRASPYSLGGRLVCGLVRRSPPPSVGRLPLVSLTGTL
jgi:hypothetical protein